MLLKRSKKIFFLERETIVSVLFVLFEILLSLSKYFDLWMCVCSQSWLTLCDPMECSPPDSSVHRVLQARILERAAISFSRRSSQPRDWPASPVSSALASGFVTIELPGKPKNDLPKSLLSTTIPRAWCWSLCRLLSWTLTQYCLQRASSLREKAEYWSMAGGEF